MPLYPRDIIFPIVLNDLKYENNFYTRIVRL